MEGRLGGRLIASLKPREKPYQVHDTDIHGFILRIQPSGVMTYYFEYRLPSGLRNRVKIEKHGKITVEQARDRVKEIAADLVKGIDPKAAKKENRVVTLGAFIDHLYSPWAESHLRSGPSNVKRLRSRFAHLLDLSLDDPKLPWLLEKWKTQRLKEEVSKLTINRDLTVLKGAFAYAVKHSAETGLTRNPLSDVRLFKVSDEESERIRYLNQNAPDEELRLLKAIDEREEEIRQARCSANLWREQRGYEKFPSLDAKVFIDHLKPMVLVSLHTGLRRGELFNLCWKDIQWNSVAPTLTVRGSISKNRKSRSIPLNKTAETVLKSWKVQQAHLDGLIFPSQDGKPFNTLKTCWSRVVKEAGLLDFRWHDLRHTFASRLVMGGVDLNAVRDLLGLKDIQMTLRYAHLSPEVKAQAVAKLDSGVGVLYEKEQKQTLFRASEPTGILPIISD